jgi:hypothetical protein
MTYLVVISILVDGELEHLHYCTATLSKHNKQM